MNLGGNELQFFVTFLVVLGCAFIALLVDYIKGNHDQLRERHVDLLVRQEKFAGRASEDAKHVATALTEILGQQTLVLREIADRPLREAEAAKRSGVLEPKRPVTHLKDIPVASIPEPKREAPQEVVSDSDKVKISLVAEPNLAPVEPSSNISLSANVIPIREPEPVPAAQSPEPAPAHDFDRFLDELVTEFETNPTLYSQPAQNLTASVPASSWDAPAGHEAAAASGPSETTEQPTQAFAEQTKDLPTARIPVPEPSPVTAVAPAVSAAPKLAGIPSGTFPCDVLDSLVAQGETVTGLIISIGVNDFEQMRTHTPKGAAEPLATSVERLIESFVRTKTFATLRGEDEFIFIEPDLTGPLAQRRLNEISERLWDFQLRNLGTFSVVFAWGSHEAHGEALSEAMERARERMLETRANRRNSSFEKSLRRLATA